jgi:hypothetical protein
MRVGIQTAVVQCVLHSDLEISVPTLVRDASMVMFMFGCCTSIAVSLRDADIDITDGRLTLVLLHRKEICSARNPI